MPHTVDVPMEQAKAKEKAQLEKKRGSLHMTLAAWRLRSRLTSSEVSCCKGEGGPPKAPASAFMLFCSAKREEAVKDGGFSPFRRAPGACGRWKGRRGGGGARG